MHGCRLVLIGTLAWFGLLAPSAWAGTMDVRRVGTVVTLETKTASASENVGIAFRSDGVFIARPTAGTDIDPAGTCSPSGADVTCSTGATITQIIVRTGGGDDTIETRFVVAGDNQDVDAPIDADMGTGDDFLLVEDNSEPTVAKGGEGSDELKSGILVDRLEGGPGADTLDAGNGADDLLGGPDFDKASYARHTGSLTLDLDNQRDDGDPFFDGGADLIQDVESLEGGKGNDLITGDDGLNDLVGGPGADRIDGRRGFDRIDGDGEATTALQSGNDIVLAQDGLADTIDCGDGVDTLFSDDIDIPFECEDRHSIPDLQPDRDGDGIDKPLDCNDLDGTVRPGAFDRPGDAVDQNCDGADAVDNDRDRDGFPAGFDCDDGRRDVHPGAREVLGNRRDEDCDGVADPFAAFPTVALLSARLGAVTNVVGLVLVDLDGGERIRLKCKGKGCKFKSRTRKAGRRADSLILDNQVRGQRLRPGAKLIVQIRRADRVRKIVTFTARANKPPRQRTRCRAPGGGKVARC